MFALIHTHTHTHNTHTHTHTHTQHNTTRLNTTQAHEKIRVTLPQQPERPIAIEGDALTAGTPVLFFPWRAVLRPASLQVLNRISVYLRAHSDISQVIVWGHCNGGQRSRMLRHLCVERAKATIDYLVSSGIEPSRLVSKGANSMGDDPTAKPGVDNACVTFHLPDLEPPEFV